MIDAMVDQQERGKKWLEELLGFMGIRAAVKIEAPSEHLDQEASWLVIDEIESPEQIKILIGEQGATIDAVQYLTSTILNLGTDSAAQSPFTVELDGYRARRQEELINLTQKVVDQVRETGQEVEMKSLSSAERRQIHTFLKESDVETESRGQEPDRRLIVRLRSA